MRCVCRLIKTGIADVSHLYITYIGDET